MTGHFGFFEKTVYYQKVEHLNDGYCNFFDTGHSRFVYKKEEHLKKTISYQKVKLLKLFCLSNFIEKVLYIYICCNVI